MESANVMKPTEFNMIVSQLTEHDANRNKRDLRLQEEYKRLVHMDVDIADEMHEAKRSADKLIDDAKRAAAEIVAEAKTKAETVAGASVQTSKEQATSSQGNAKELALALDNKAQLALRKQPPALTDDELSALWTELRPASSPQLGCKPWQVRFDFMSTDDKDEIEAAVAIAQGGILGPGCQVALHIVEMKSMAVVDATGKTRAANVLLVTLSPTERGPLSMVEKLLMNLVHDALLKGAMLRKQVTAKNRALTRANNFDTSIYALPLRVEMSKELSKVERALCPVRRITEPVPLCVRPTTARWVDEELAAGMLTNCPNYQDRLARIKTWSEKNLDTFRAYEVFETPKETLQRLIRVVLQRHYRQAEGDAKTVACIALLRLHEGDMRDLE
ncbi:hypothetical protein DL546_008680 [Coniochaeta pulveracea]|uniref:Uncharacterized protein n=1 Tax=Coniochaeta pulveracea TaxID=177199 RepID=A0A420YEK5_9PEZI|nr:hypothetical protein DL546_008680 [Coniochaeta pulveracea]